MELWTLHPVADYALLEYDAIIRSQHSEAIYCVQIPWILWPLKRTLRCLKTLGSNYPIMQRHMPQKWNPQLIVPTLSKLFPIVLVHMHEQVQESECASKIQVTDNVQNLGHNYDRKPLSECFRSELC
jgi:hypothetical protein